MNITYADVSTETLYSQFIQTKEFIYNLLPKLNSPEYITAHKKFYNKVVSENNR